MDWAVNELDAGESWFGFDAVRNIGGLPQEILVVPLYGHTRGHVGVAIDAGDGWLLHAGDAYTEPHAIGTGPLATASRALHMITAHPSYPRAQLKNMHRLTSLVADHTEEVTVFCSHDSAAFTRLASQVSD